MTIAAERPYRQGLLTDLPHLHRGMGARRPHDVAAEARKHARREHHHEMVVLHEQELQHDPRDWRARHTLGSGGIKPFIIA
ncbi:hypothetical protein [Demequina rhizosphaerae]|uniref:hypothetical protein n=1 Tax=Demequina rhizosphaerae TaxID=1638985 RepID=UPI000784FD19|nr:hypothetical protein [Demequina rhizosphaerae]